MVKSQLLYLFNIYLTFFVWNLSFLLVVNFISIALVFSIVFVPKVFVLTGITLNSELLIGYNNIHPTILYISILLYIAKLTNESKLFYIDKYLIIYLSLAFYLGSLWGYGNTSWGFFWVKDKIEIILCVFVVLIYSYMHLKYSKYNTSVILYLLTTLLLFLIIFRNGLLNTRHMFINMRVFANNFKFLIIFLCNRISVYFFVVVFGYKCIYTYYFIYLFSGLQKRCFTKVVVVFYHLVILIILVSWLKIRVSNISVPFIYSFINYEIKFSLLNVYSTLWLLIYKQKFSIIYLYIFKFFIMKEFFIITSYVGMLLILICINIIY